MTLRFSDGVEIDTSGELRLLKLPDGWYVVGQHMLLACSDKRDAEETLKEMQAEARENKR